LQGLKSSEQVSGQGAAPAVRLRWFCGVQSCERQSPTLSGFQLRKLRWITGLASGQFCDSERMAREWFL